MAKPVSGRSDPSLQSPLDLTGTLRAAAPQPVNAPPSSSAESGPRDTQAGARLDPPPSSSLPPRSFECLDDEAVQGLLSGALEGSERLRALDHLARCPRCTEQLEDAGRSCFGGSLPLGSLVAQRYRVIRFVAQGGMGEVYEAYDGELGVRLALKVVPTGSGDERRPAVLRALTREVLLARSIAHPNVCRTYDLGRHELGPDAEPLHFLTMEFVDGERLSEHVAQGPLSLPEVHAVARDLLLGLGAAHRAGVLHRDLKSDNVMLRVGADDTLQAVIMDFGLARSLHNPNVAGGSVNQRIEGSLLYMAPEQLLAQPLSFATDIFGFGVVLFEMLTGRTPFESQITMAAAMKRCEEPPPSPSRWVSGLSPALDRVVERCLEPLPERRYPDAQAALAALEEAIAAASAPRSGPGWGHTPVLVSLLTLAGLVAPAGERTVHPVTQTSALTPRPPAVQPTLPTPTAGPPPDEPTPTPPTAEVISIPPPPVVPVQRVAAPPAASSAAPARASAEPVAAQVAPAAPRTAAPAPSEQPVTAAVADAPLPPRSEPPQHEAAPVAVARVAEEAEPDFDAPESAPPPPPVGNVGMREDEGAPSRSFDIAAPEPDDFSDVIPPEPTLAQERLWASGRSSLTPTPGEERPPATDGLFEPHIGEWAEVTSKPFGSRE